MKLSRLFGTTLREAPTEAEVISHQLLLRAGFIRPLAAGIFSYLPLAQRALVNIMRIIRAEMDAIGGQEISMPVVHPAELWQQTGRWDAIGAEMGRFTDRNNRAMALAMTHEEVVAALTKSEIRSYRQLPALVYQLQTKWRDDPRPRAGLIRVREFTMLDSYSLDATWEGLDTQYQAHYEAYFNIFRRCELPVVAVQSDTGMMGGQMAHEYMYLTPIGEDSLLFCDSCGYSANRQAARFSRPTPAAEAPLPLERVATPHASSIAELAAFLNIPAARTAKAVFFMAEPADGSPAFLVFAVVRGDMEVNETKLANAVQARDLRPATDVEIRAIGAEPGYASPLGLRGARVVVDELIPASPNLVAGANETGYHLRNVNYGRDFTADQVVDLAAATEGSPCPQCGAAMRLSRGVEVGNIFKLGTKYTDALECGFSDENGQIRPVIMGSYGIGVGRLLACIAEQHHDENGLCWPAEVAPYPVHLTLLSGKTGEPDAVAQALAAELTAAGLEPLFDDRTESAGVKFADADLIGLPLRITVSERALKQGGVEFKPRRASERFIVPLENAVAAARQILGSGT
ncbi:MAG TPA: proline--tRNA ligase [Anaerolineaceae bacterium]|nr:proline--tRNA ligase [Anaerolineaceae bacterium]HQH86814.1 proline--tRNA ligase [Anaerolineaceae bacterium]